MEDNGLAVPLYEKVRRTIVSGIESGEFTPGSFLPPEPSLMAQCGVSRVTLRRAIGDLCAEGWLQRQQGRGTLVMPRKVRQTLVSLSGFSETMGGLGRKASHRILAQTDEPDAPAIAARLSARTLVRFDRLLEEDGRPMTLEALWFDRERFAEVIPDVAAGGSFFGALREVAGIVPAHTERQIDVGFATDAERAELGILPGQPVFRVEKLVTDNAGKPLALSCLVTPGHLVSFTMKS
ncbi:GntR family transcriptional regulator [Pseudotabrizicola alkalilacus]|uniref:GntR family transcriptional regulator n=1 Tax=Pseudotabrizicola alkalilacus TaxID=2305252 RepID=A0A411YX08_9RHOB|nr:GntR family transcriptional regulator [Pseudotabrizicola alkalilacus]RGP35279.1 GntR family transcriptional regulator [Pseudotabrizicola alkalilacus]